MYILTKGRMTCRTNVTSIAQQLVQLGWRLQMSNKTEERPCNTPEEAEEWLEETIKLAELDHKLKQMQDAKALGIPFKNLNEREE